ncbi:MAG: DUF6291 domain-containing protein [Dysgonomonas sp.]
MEKKGQKQNSFVLYTDYIKHISLLTDQEAGQLFKALFKFVEDGKDPEFTGALNMCFSFVSSQIQRDKEKYTDVCQKRAEAGKNGGKQKQANLANAKSDKQNIANVANAKSDKQKQANLADNDTVSEIDIDTAIEDDKSKYSKEFKQFWDAYPKKADKGQAYKNYKARLKDGYSSEELLIAVVNYKQQCEKQRTEQRFIKHAKTFLSDTLPFTDYIKTEAQSNTELQDSDEENPFVQYLKEG